MKYCRSLRFAGFFAAFLFPALAIAQTISISGSEPALLQLGAGDYNLLRFHSDPPTSTVFRGEYRFASQFFYLHPVIGAEGNTRGGVYGYGGVALNIFLFDRHLVLTPEEAFGGWSQGSDQNKNLGSTFEIRSGAELDYRFDDGARAGVSFDHISNAGVSHRNPGVEEVLAVLSIPLAGMP